MAENKIRAAIGATGDPDSDQGGGRVRAILDHPETALSHKAQAEHAARPQRLGAAGPPRTDAVAQTTADPRLKVRLLGGFEVLRGARPVVLPTRKCMGLLAVLALRPGTAVGRERLTDLLWPRSAPAQARASLRQALAMLRRTLGADGTDPIESVGDGVRLRPGSVPADTEDLEAALDRASADAPQRVAALYRGDLLEGFALDEAPFDDWLQAASERLRRRTLRFLTGHLDRQVESGEIEAALQLGERLLELDPAAEDVHQALIRLDIGRGALGGAVRRYEHCRRVLAERLGIPPSPATRGLLRALRARPVGAGDAGTLPLVAVLPFADRSPQGTQAHLALGFAEDVIRTLARFRSLRVMAAQSSFALTDTRTDPREAGARLGARYCLAGSVAERGATLRIGAELLDTASGHCLWSERYDVRAAEVFAAQDEISGAVAAALAVRIDGDLLHRAVHKPLESLEAYDCWLRGVAALRQGSPESLEESRPLFRRALEIDPGFARAYTGLSLSHFNEWSCLAWERWDDNERHAYAYAEQGARMDASDHLTHFVLGRILLYRRDFARAELHLARAEALNPNDADMLAQMAFSDACLGEARRGTDRAALARRLNPFHDDWYFAFAAFAALLARQLPESIDLARRAPLAATDMHACLACAQAHLGRLDEAHRHRDAFLDIFRRRICSGADPAPDAPARWLLHVNPVRRAEDRAFLVEGLGRAGLAVPEDLAVAALHRQGDPPRCG
jgi:DNA-binding SARP family transcriptional activator/TolB-like protein